MATASGIWNHAAPINSLASGHPDAATTGSAGTSSGDGSTISSNDFLTLLVTEMQNQDPTANTDPNEYINQLVQVNSLEQLININQTLSSDLGASATNGMQPGLIASAAAIPRSSSSASSALSPAGSTASSGAPALNDVTPQGINTTAGNLGVPHSNPAAQRVAQALTHRAHLD